MKKLMTLIKEKWELISYLFWGGCTTLVNWISYSICVKYLGTPILAANAISWILAVIFAFVTNKWFVFHSKSWEPDVFLKELGLFFSARIVTGVFEIVAVPLLVRLGLDQAIFGVDGAVAKILVSVVVVILNYVFSKLFIFKGKDGAQGE